jgi:hypothetical protein
MSDELQVAVFLAVVLAVFIVPFFLWRVRSKKGTEPYDDDWEQRARRDTHGGSG